MNLYYNDTYVAAAHAFDTTRKAGWIAGSLIGSPIRNVEIVSPASATEKDLLRAHSPEYLDAIRYGSPRDLAESQGFQWDPALYPAVLASTGGVCAAALDAISHVRNAGSLSPGRHHARRGQGAGFCTLNGLAVAALAALDHGARHVLILDLDAHCGGGTFGILGDNDRVSCIDLSTSRFDSYSSRRKDWTLDLIAPSMGEGAYLNTLADRLRSVRRYDFDLCLYNAGMDPHQDCEVGGMEGITTPMIDAREKMVFAWARGITLPVAFVLAGGYTGTTLSQAALVDLHRLTISAAASR